MRINSIIFIFYLILVVITFGFLFSSSPIIGGDYVPINSETLGLFANTYGWCSYITIGGNCIPITLHYVPMGWLMEFLSFITGYNFLLVEKLVWWIPFFVISFSSIILLFKKVFPTNPLWFISPLIFVWNSYILMILGGGQIAGIALAYGFMPLLFYLFIILFEGISKGKTFKQTSFLFALYILALGAEAVFDTRILYIFLSGTVLYLFVDFVFNKKNATTFIKNVVLTILVPCVGLVLLHAYWILPSIIVGQNPLQQLGSAYSTVGAAKFFSFATFENAISLLHPNWPENLFGKTYFMRSEFLVLPILAFSSLFFLSSKDKVKNNQFVLFFALLALVASLLAKGANEPFGNLYLWMFEHIPGFQVFRDATKWYVLVAISYSILIPFTLFKIQEVIKKKFFK